MVAANDAGEYLEEVRQRLCARCIIRRPGAPPCDILGVGCGIERHLAKLVEICHAVNSRLIDPYADAVEAQVCTDCGLRESRACPCPMRYLLPLAVEAIESADRRRRAMAANWSEGT